MKRKMDVPVLPENKIYDLAILDAFTDDKSNVLRMKLNFR